MTLEVCPSCGVQDSIFLSHGPAVGLDGRLYGGRTEAFCNNVSCDQRYWYYPRSGRITRRNTGVKYQAFLRQRVDVMTVNAARRNLRLSPLSEPLVLEAPPKIEIIRTETGPLAPFDIEFAEIAEDDDEPRPWWGPAALDFRNWWYYLLAAITSPFRKDHQES